MGGDKIPSCKSSQKATEEWEIAEVINPQDSAVSRIVFAEAVKNA
jgi:RNA polymerase subunit RPABC4/transcription elongation factor Spt4